MRIKPNNEALKGIINITFLILSSFLIVYFLVNLTPNPVIRVGVGIFAIILEIFMQYLLSTGRAKWKGGLWFQALLLFLCYGVYVLVYAVPSATGFFMAEINTQEQAEARQEIIEDTNKQRLQQINSTINNLNAQLQTESKSGYGQKSQQIMDEIKQLTAEQATIQNSFQNTKTATTTGAKDLFKILGDVFNIPGNVFKILIFGISVLMVYVGLIMTSWDITLPQISAEAIQSIETLRKPELNGFETPIIETETPIETAETASGNKAICPVCGKHFPYKHDKTFCSSNCRVKAYRNQVKEAV